MRWQSIIWSLATIVLAAAISIFVAKKTTQRQPHHHHHHGGHEDFHQWLHDNLKITPEQETILRPQEEAFESERQALQQKIKSAGKTLAGAIQSSAPDSPDVLKAHEALLAAQGELQRATLKHFFTMKSHLSEEQGQKLLDWTHDSLIHGHRN